jgi:transposase InsO family protein
VSFLKEHYSFGSLERICGLFGKGRQAYYEHKWRSSQLTLEHEIIIQEVLRIRAHLPRVGGRKLLYMLQDFLQAHHIKMGRDQLFDLLRQYKLLVKKRKRKVFTTDSNHRFRKYPNLIKELELTRAEQLWVCDITYISTKEGFCYLSLITDAYSRKIVGFNLERTLAAQGCVAALTMALQTLTRPMAKLIHHSDRGSQYCCSEYVNLLQQNLIAISMTEDGDPYENSVAERINGILKDELNLGQVFKNFYHAVSVIQESIKLYNEMRPHGSCDYLTPQQAHAKEGKLKQRWTNYYGKHQENG